MYFYRMKHIYIASAAILNDKNELLLVRKNGSPFFQLTGGKIDPNETEIETVIREIKEEIGLSVPLDQLTYLGEHQTQAVNEVDTVVHGSIFIAQLNTSFTPTIANEIEKFAWLNTTNFQKYQWAHLAKEFVQPWWLQLHS